MPRFSLFESPALRRFLPSVAGAFDAEEVKRRLANALFDSGRRPYTLRLCELSQATWVPGECCLMRYGLEIVNRENGHGSRTLVTARVFPDQPACDRYAASLAPLTALAAGRGD